MARKIALWAGGEGRDEGKQFEITEMSAAKAEAWAIRALCLLAESGFDVPAGEQSFAKVAEFGLTALSKVDYVKVKPLLDEMLACVKYIPPDHPNTRQPLTVGDTDLIEEVKTLFMLRVEVWKLHANF